MMYCEETHLLRQSTDSSVTFLQEQHAKTLQGLHGEIQKLQKKCARLTFELTMAGGTTTEGKDSTDFSEQEKALKVSQEAVITLKSQVDTLNEQNALLNHEVVCLVRKTENKLKEKDEVINTLHLQLEDKSNTVAQLVNKLHQTQRLLHKMETKPGNSSFTIPHGVFPTPPKEPPPEGVYRTGRITRRLRRPVNSSQLPDISRPSSDSIDESNMTLPSIPSTIIRSSLPNVQLSNPFLPQRLTQSYEQTSSYSSGNQATGRKPGSPTFSVSPEDLKARENIIHEQISHPQMLQRALHTHPSKPILPPISGSEDELLSTFPTEPSRRRFHLAKAQGLTSAPCSHRLVNYNTGTSREVEDSDGMNKKDGKLMIKHEVGVWHQLHPHESK